VGAGGGGKEVLRTHGGRRGAEPQRKKKRRPSRTVGYRSRQGSILTFSLKRMIEKEEGQKNKDQKKLKTSPYLVREDLCKKRKSSGRNNAEKCLDRDFIELKEEKGGVWGIIARRVARE